MRVGRTVISRFAWPTIKLLLDDVAERDEAVTFARFGGAPAIGTFFPSGMSIADCYSINDQSIALDSKDVIMKRQSSGATTSAGPLDSVLVSFLDFHSQVKQAHWNVTGSNFIGVHKLFDSFAEQLSESIDAIAERQRFLGSFTDASASHVADTTELPQLPSTVTASDEMIEFIVNNATTISNSMKSAIEEFENNNDPGTVDLLTQTMREIIDQNIYLLKSHLG
jgi:starvation-inducible DNA-binding protein